MKAKLVALVCLMSLTVLAYTNVLEAGLVAYWPFDEGKGKDAKDASDNGNDGDINGAEWVDGKFGEALEFDGNFVLVPNDDSYNFTKEQSLS